MLCTYFLATLLRLVGATSGSDLPLAHDPTLFCAVVEAFPAIQSGGEFQLWPEPFATESPADSAEIRARRAVIEVLQLKVAATMDSGECPGTLAAIDTLMPGCPTRWTSRFAIGRPYPLPGGVVPSWRGAGRYAGRRAQVVVPVSVLTIGPMGATQSSMDFYATRDEYGWEIVAYFVLDIRH